ncbi:MAG: hypothetical protein ACR2NB_13505 [Solirubrobacteraceae bacterium]
MRLDRDGHPVIQRESRAAASCLPDALARLPVPGFLDAHLLVDEDHPVLPGPGDEHRRLVEPRRLPARRPAAAPAPQRPQPHARPPYRPR